MEPDTTAEPFEPKDRWSGFYRAQLIDELERVIQQRFVEAMFGDGADRPPRLAGATVGDVHWLMEEVFDAASVVIRDHWPTKPGGTA